MPTGTCRLCHTDAELRDSHFLPKAFFKLLLKVSKAAGNANANPVAFNEVVALQTSAQITDYLLCHNCEDRFSKNGEKWMVENCWRANDEFRLREALERVEPICEWESGVRVFDGAAIGDANVAKLVYFAASVFWRGSAHEWGPLAGTKPVRLALGLFEEMLRRFLLGEVGFPADSSLVVTVNSSTDHGANELVLFPWKSNDQNILRQYRFVIPGVAFQFFIGERMPSDIAALSTVHRSEHPLYLGSHDFVLEGGAALLEKATPKGNLR